MSLFVPRGMGWSPDVPDPRDVTSRDDEVVRLLRQLRVHDRLPDRIDWREFCAPVQDQGQLGSSSAHAIVSLIQYFQRRATGRLYEPSVLFVYQTALRLLKRHGDSGITLRSALRSIIHYGFPSEDTWPYCAERLGDIADAFVHASAENISGLRFVRLDERHASGEETLKQVRSFLAAGFACAFGFPVCKTLTTDGDIHFPTVYDDIRGGQAVAAVGFDDNRRIRSDKGALLVRSSWGSHWGRNGYGWLPYAYVRECLAGDFWTAIAPQWIKSGEFYQPTPLEPT